MRFLLPALLLVVAGCNPTLPQRVPMPLAEPGARVAIPARSVEVRAVSLPSYATQEEIWRETPTGSLVADPQLLWADEPVRATTLALAGQLAALTRARVAAEPWPFESLPQARLEVRFDTMVAGADDRFRVAGAYYSSRLDVERDRSGAFDIAVPIAPESGAPGIAAARAAVLRDLARLIAEDGF